MTHLPFSGVLRWSTGCLYGGLHLGRVPPPVRCGLAAEPRRCPSVAHGRTVRRPSRVNRIGVHQPAAKHAALRSPSGRRGERKERGPHSVTPLVSVASATCETALRSFHLDRTCHTAFSAGLRVHLARVPSAGRERCFSRDVDPLFPPMARPRTLARPLRCPHVPYPPEHGPRRSSARAAKAILYPPDRLSYNRRRGGLACHGHESPLHASAANTK